jgi:hypothetical protein
LTPEIREKMERLAEEHFDNHPFNRDQKLSFIQGFTAAHQLMSWREDFLHAYYNPKDTSFKQMIETFITLSESEKEKLIDLAKAFKALGSKGECLCSEINARNCPVHNESERKDGRTR